MLQNKQSEFLRDKIMQLKTAIVHCPEDQFFNQQSVFAYTLQVDESGALWLAVDKPVECGDSNEPSFDVVLNYQSKGLPFDLDVLGEARLVTDETEINNMLPARLRKAGKEKLVLRVQIIDVDYWEHRKPILKSIGQKLRYIFSGHHANDTKQSIYPNHQMTA